MNIGHHPAVACLQMHSTAFDHCETNIHHLLAKLELQNKTNKDLTHLITKLTHARAAGKADFTQDPETFQAIEAIYKEFPEAFNNHLTFQWKNSNEIDAVLQALDAQVKIHADGINQTTLLLNMRYEERVKYTDCALKTLEICNRFIESILNRMIPR